MSELKNRYDFILLFDVQDGNPNGDPDAGNLPRVDPETGHGIVTDVCLKRKIRNYIYMLKKNEPPFEIYVKEKAILNQQHERAHAAVGNDTGKRESKPKHDKKNDEAKMWMCMNFFDVRTFGAVMSTGDWKCGQVRGPVQLTFARSVEPVIPLEYCITRMAVATAKEAEDQGGDNRTMGRKFTIPYGLYKSYGFISANLANQTSFSEEDLKLLWETLANMFDHDRSASHGLMQTRGLFVFKHDSEFGRAPAHRLFDLIKIKKKATDKVARSFDDYEVEIDQINLPEGVELIQMQGTRVAARV
jgi:CRISPR-associated protein Csd2